MWFGHFVVGISSIGLMVLAAGAVSGQTYPNKPIRIVTSQVGGGSDFDSRIIAQGISGPLGQQVIVDNRGGILPGEVVSRAPSDGYTLLTDGTSFWIGPLLQKIPYDPVKDFAPVTLTSSSPYVLVVHPTLAANSVKELIALAKAKPGVLNYGSGGTGSGPHLSGELLKSMAGVNTVRIAYSGSGAGLIALIGGETQFMFAPATAVQQHLKAAKFRALAVTSAEPSALAPGLPTMSASGLPGYEMIGLTGMFAPAKTPATIINRLNQEIVRFLKTPDVKERFLNAGEEIVASSPEQMAAAIKSDTAKIGKLIKDANIKTE